MAIDKIIIEVTGDAKGVDKTIDQLEKVGTVDKQNAEQFKKSNAQFQKGINDSSKAVNKHVESLKGLVPAVTAAFAVQSVIAFGKASLNAFIEAERGEKLLRNALNNNEAAFKRLTEAAKKYQQTTVYDDDAIIAAQTFLATQGRTEDQINRVIKAATNLSAVTGESLQSSVEKLDATFEGSIGRFGKLDSRLKTLTQTQLENGVAVDMLAEKYAGFAKAELETTAGKLRRLENAWGEVKETVGAAIVDMADKIRDNTLTGGLIDRLLFGESQELKDQLLKIKLVRGAMADLNSDIGEFEDARANEAARIIEAQKAEEKQIRNVAFLKAEITRLTKELDSNGKTVDQNREDHKKLVAVQEELAAIFGKTTEKVKEQKKELESGVPTEMLENIKAGQLAQLEAEEKARLKSIELAQAGADEAARIKAEEVAERLRLDDILAENEKKNQEEVTANLEAEAQRREQIEKALQQAVSQLITMAVDYQLSLSQKQTDYELELLQEKLDAERITQDQYNSQRRAILRDQAQKQKEAAIIKATIDTANAVINAFSEGGPVLAAIAGAVGIAQLAIISATPIPEFEKGGRIGGKRHRDGGTPLIAEKDEFIINRKAAQKIGFDNLEMLNKGIVPVKLLKQGLSDGREKRMENTLKAVFGSNDFDTYPIEKELRKTRKHDAELTHLLIKNLRHGQRKRGGY